MDEGMAMEKAGWAAQLSAVLLVWELQLLAVPMTALSVFALAWLWGPAYHPDHVPMRAAVVVARCGRGGCRSPSWWAGRCAFGRCVAV
jgi:hypothetical protein